MIARLLGSALVARFVRWMYRDQPIPAVTYPDV